MANSNLILATSKSILGRLLLEALAEEGGVEVLMQL